MEELFQTCVACAGPATNLHTALANKAKQIKTVEHVNNHPQMEL